MTKRTTGSSRPRVKRLPPQLTQGERGVNLIESVVLEMGSRWNPTVKTDIGIDGQIELFDPATGEPLGLTLQVQSKTVRDRLPGETDESFSYTCRPQDLDYWLRGNAPVLLIVSRPESKEVYWVSVKDYFARGRTANTIRFDKRRDRFDQTAFDALFKVSRPPASGLYLAPRPKTETLVSNLLAVRSFGPMIWVSDTTARKPADVWRVFRDAGERAPSEFILAGKRIISFHDLREGRWREICDPGTTEPFASEEWAYSSDPDRRRSFVWLLTEALRERLYPLVRHRRDLDVFAFIATEDLRPRTIRYPSGDRTARRTVFEVYEHEWQGVTYRDYRHSAFSARFRLYDGRWYLEITPTYAYTFDGKRLNRRHADKLAGIKRLERNEGVLAQLRMWAAQLQRGADLFTREYPFLSFGDLVRVDLPVGIDDPAWQATDELMAGAGDETQQPLGLVL